MQFKDSFAKICLHTNDGNIIESFKTTIRKNDPNPQFNEVSVFKVKTKDLNSVFLKISIIQITDKKEFEIGYFYVGPKENNTTMSHWRQMVRLVRRQVYLEK